jgi:hypothetical protein
LVGALPATWRLPGWCLRRSPLWFAGLSLIGAASVLLMIYSPTFTGEDWSAIRHGAELVVGGQSPYIEPLYRWSPVAAWLSVPLLTLPYWAWVALHVVALAAFRDVRIFILGLVAWPFWQDAGVGNVLIFVVLAAWWALRGNRWATWAYLLMVLLMPRPLMLPVAAWLLWQDRSLWLPFACFAAASVLGAFATGYGFEWAGVLAHAGAVDMANPYQIGPSLLIGSAWLLIGIPLAAVLTWRGRLGLAALAASPYWLPYYLLFGLLELRRRSHADSCLSAGSGWRLRQR